MFVSTEKMCRSCILLAAGLSDCIASYELQTFMRDCLLKLYAMNSKYTILLINVKRGKVGILPSKI